MGLFSNIKTGAERYPALTGIRAMGATAVFFDHFPFPAGYHIRINVMAFFFVLSGFLIVRLYYNKIDVPGQNMRAYFVNRFARIYPVYFLLLTVAVFIKGDYRPLNLFENYTLIHAFFYNQDNYIIWQSWSLTVEECFYVLAPIIIFLIKIKGFITSVVFACLLLTGALLVSRLGIPLLKTPSFIFSLTFFGNFAEFYAGVFLALIIMKKEKNGTIGLKGLRYTICGVLGVAALIIAMGYIYANPPLNMKLIVLINNFLIPVPVAILYYGLMCEKSFIARLLSARVTAITGKSSYTFYLLHGIIVYSVCVPWVLPYFGEHYLLCAIITCVFTWYLSALVFTYFEEPVNIFIRKKWLARQSPVEVHT